MRQVTLCFLLDEERICLAMKKRGFGEGKWNGMGGKTHPGESLEEAVLRELEEESGVKSTVDQLEKVAEIAFHFPEERADWDQEVHVFFIGTWEGEPLETEEMRPQWFLFDDIPYDQMWSSDAYWLPVVMQGNKIKGTCKFKGEGNEVEDFTHAPLA
jgi:8-oxo-dGTP pyrophosphatase MutT (NUDIX family)